MFVNKKHYRSVIGIGISSLLFMYFLYDIGMKISYYKDQLIYIVILIFVLLSLLFLLIKKAMSHHYSLAFYDEHLRYHFLFYRRSILYEQIQEIELYRSQLRNIKFQYVRIKTKTGHALIIETSQLNHEQREFIQFLEEKTGLTRYNRIQTKASNHFIAFSYRSYMTLLFEVFIVVSLVHITYQAEQTFLSIRNFAFILILGSATVITFIYSLKQNFKLFLEDDHLIYRSFFMRREVPFHSIYKIEKRLRNSFNQGIYSLEVKIKNKKSITLIMRDNLELEKKLEEKINLKILYCD